MTDTPANIAVPADHLNYQYIQRCTDGEELERIYKTLTSGTVGPFPLLEPVALSCIQKIHPNSEILQRISLNNRQQHDQQHQVTETNSSPMHILEILSIDAPSVATSPPVENIPNGLEPKSPAPRQKAEDEGAGELDDEHEDTQISTGTPLSDQNAQAEKTAEQYYLDGDQACEAGNYQESIDLYTKSLTRDSTNLDVYMKRALAYRQLDDVDASIQDCSHILSLQPDHQQALSKRASCFFAKEKLVEAQTDLEKLLSLNPDYPGASNMSYSISLRQTNNTPYLDFHSRKARRFGELPHQYSSLRNTQLTEEEVTPRGDDTDDTPVSNEVGFPVYSTVKKRSVHLLRGNASPSTDDGSEPSETSSEESALPDTADLDHRIAVGDEIKPIYALPHRSISHIDSYHHPSAISTINLLKDSPHRASSGTEHFDHLSSLPSRSSTNNTIDDAISDSSFSSTIQTWLRDSVGTQSTRRVSSFYDRPWSNALLPWSLDGLQRDINRYQRYGDVSNAIDISKLLLKNGILDYHQHAEYIVNTLVICAECYFEWKSYRRVIQYASEALQYDKYSSKALMLRARAFEEQNLLLFGYADYAQVPRHDFDHYTAVRACERLAVDLKASKGETWREQLPVNFHDDGFFNYLQTQENAITNELYPVLADQLALDGCFVLAIRCYTRAIELEPDNQPLYARRATCYIKVHEGQKAVADCDRILSGTEDRFTILYCKARALKIARDHCSYESTLKECLKLQPTNQILLAEYHSQRHESVPRKKRRIRLSSSPSKMLKTQSVAIHSTNQLSFEELEQIRAQITVDSAFDFNEQLYSFELNDIQSQCAFVLRLPEENMLAAFDSATVKLIETILDASRTMIELEGAYQDEHLSLVLPFSYTRFCFRILVALSTLPKLDEMLPWIDDKHQTIWNELLEHFSSSPLFINESAQLNRLKQGTVG